jgi:hypothetical protein
MGEALFDDFPPRRTVNTRRAVILVTVSVVLALAVARSQEPATFSVEAQLAHQPYPSVTPLEAIEPPPLDQLREVLIPDTEYGTGSASSPEHEVASLLPPMPDDEKPTTTEPKGVQLSPDEKTQLFRDFLQSLRSR